MQALWRMLPLHITCAHHCAHPHKLRSWPSLHNHRSKSKALLLEVVYKYYLFIGSNLSAPIEDAICCVCPLTRLSLLDQKTKRTKCSISHHSFIYPFFSNPRNRRGRGAVAPSGCPQLIYPLSKQQLQEAPWMLAWLTHFPWKKMKWKHGREEWWARVLRCSSPPISLLSFPHSPD